MLEKTNIPKLVYKGRRFSVLPEAPPHQMSSEETRNQVVHLPSGASLVDVDGLDFEGMRTSAIAKHRWGTGVLVCGDHRGWRTFGTKLHDSSPGDDFGNSCAPSAEGPGFRLNRGCHSKLLIEMPRARASVWALELSRFAELLGRSHWAKQLGLDLGPTPNATRAEA